MFQLTLRIFRIFFNSEIKVKSLLSELQWSNGSLINCDSENCEMANILNDYFATVFITEDNTNIPSFSDSYML